MKKASESGATAVIYHNPACGTSRKALEALRMAGFEPELVDYLNNPPDRKTLESLLELMGCGLRDILRKRGAPYDELGLDRPDLTDDEIFEAIARHPILIERPIVRIGERATLCRPIEKIHELIAADGKS